MPVTLGPRNKIGPKGDKGDQGERGPQGIQGPKGLNGIDGLNGLKGLRGTQWFSGTIYPAPFLGLPNDYYLQTSTGKIFEKTVTGWKHIMTLAPSVIHQNTTVATVGFKRGNVKFMYNEVLLIALEQDVNILTYQPPTEKAADISHINISGDNIAEITIYKNNQVLEKNRFTWTDFNEKIDLGGITILDSDTIKVEASNCYNEQAYFNATIYADEYTPE